jgi:SAM-dependent methyltransferase
MSIIPKDVILLPEMSPEFPERWVAMNVFSRTCLGVSSEVLTFMGNIVLGDNRIKDMFNGKLFRIWEIERFSNEDGLLADPSRFMRNVVRWKDMIVDTKELISRLKQHVLLVDDENYYCSRFQLKKNLLDYEHFGNFHQQHGQYLMVVKRENPANWWLKQKFTEDMVSVRSDNLYGAVQWKFLTEYFHRKIKPGWSAIDVGCGTGIYSNLMAKYGANVLGIDPNKDYISIATANAAPNTRFEIMNIGELGALNSIPNHFADIIYMSDALLFYFVPYYPGQKADIQILFADFLRILKPDGIFICLEPHCLFFLTPWLGSEDHPFTVVNEYRQKLFGIVPNFSQLIQAFTRGGFAITHMEEPTPDPEFEKKDKRAYHFARQFPLWHLFELKKT